MDKNEVAGLDGIEFGADVDSIVVTVVLILSVLIELIRDDIALDGAVVGSVDNSEVDKDEIDNVDGVSKAGVDNELISFIEGVDAVVATTVVGTIAVGSVDFSIFGEVAVDFCVTVFDSVALVEENWVV